MREIFYWVLTIIITIINVVSYLPQIIQLIKTKSSQDISLHSWYLWDLSSSLWFILMIMDKVGVGMMLLQVLSMLLCYITTFLAFIYRKREQIC